MNVTAMLIDAQQAHKRLQALWREAKPWLLAGHRLVITIKPEGRTSGQNAALHAWIGEIAANCTLGGQQHDAEVWKRALVAAWTRERGEPVLIIPAIDGQGVDLVPKRTSALTKAECAELLEYVVAYATQQGIGVEEPETT
jgi:hypothetical protein